MNGSARRPEQRIGFGSAQDKQLGKLQAIVNGMSNWRRNQWARAGYQPAEAPRYLRMKRTNRKGSA